MRFMAKSRFPVTSAIRTLRDARVSFEEFLYDYEERGGTRASSAALGVPEHQVIKTLIMEDEKREPMVVLMHGDCEVSTKQLARYRGSKSIVPCAPEHANRHSGYQVGGTSPFGTRKTMPCYIQGSILKLGIIYINGGKRGFLVKLSALDAQRILNAELVEIRA